jgi:hypothetical protein
MLPILDWERLTGELKPISEEATREKASYAMSRRDIRIRIESVKGVLRHMSRGVAVMDPPQGISSSIRTLPQRRIRRPHSLARCS